MGTERKGLGSYVWLGFTLARAGLSRPGNPVRVARELRLLKAWGTTLAGSLISAAARNPDAPAIIDERGTLSYGELDRRTTRLATALLAGQPGKAGVLCRNHRGMIETLVACGKAGVDVVMLNTGLGTDEALAVIKDQRLDLLVADAEFSGVLEKAGVRTVLAWTDEGTERDTLESLIAGAAAKELTPPERPGRTIVLTSGTTGPPKGAQRPPKPGLFAMASILSMVPLRVRGTTLIEAPLFHTWGYFGLQISFGLRATMVLNRRYDPLQALASVERHKCDALFAVPVMMQRILELPEASRKGHDTSSLRVVGLSGSVLPLGLAVRFMDDFGDVLYNVYGSTEAAWVGIATPRDLRAHPATAGRPPRGTRLMVIDEEGAPVPAGVPGRIFAVNEVQFEGYTNGAVKEARDGMMSLGDVGHLDAEGLLYIDGRDDDMIVSGGENVFPQQTEDALAGLPGVREVAVVGVPDEEFGQRLAAYVVPEDGASLTDDDVRRHVREHLARFAVPRDVHFLDELPRNATGKVLKRLLTG